MPRLLAAGCAAAVSLEDTTLQYMQSLSIEKDRDVPLKESLQSL
jgi:hypothetical protein